MDNDATVTQKRAAELCHVSRSTIVKHRQSGKFPGTTQDAKGVWQIPIHDLLAAGLLDSVEPSSVDEVSRLSDELSSMRHQLELMQIRYETSELLLKELRERASEQSRMLRMLDVGASSAEQANSIDQKTTQGDNHPRKRRWWQR